MKSQRGAKSVAQYGMAHQNADETLVINAFVAQNCKDLNFKCKVCVEKNQHMGGQTLISTSCREMRLPQRKYTVIGSDKIATKE